MRNVKFWDIFVTCRVGPVAGLGCWVLPSLLGRARSSLVKKRVGQVLALGPSSPSYFGLRVWLTKYTLVSFPCILFIFLFWYPVKRDLFYSRKFHKKLGIFVDLFMGPRILFYFCSLRILFFIACSIYRPLLLGETYYTMHFFLLV